MRSLVTLLGLAALVLVIGCGGQSEVPVLRVGHVGHDHHSALYVAGNAGEEFKELYGIWLKEIRPRELYELYDGTKRVAEVELYKAGGGSEMPTMMSQGAFDIGFGGVAAIEFFVDKGSPLRMIAPLHSKGDMLVVNPGVPAGNWPEFINWLKARPGQVNVGYKSPVAVALLIFQRALDHEGISYTGDKGNASAKVLLVNVKEEANLNAALQSGQILAYVSNNPWCAIAESKGFGRAIAELHNLPPGVFEDHPCCGIAGNDSAVARHPEAVAKLLELFAVASHYIATEPEKTAELVGQWLGISPEVILASMATSGYSMEPDAAFRDGMWVWYEEMVGLGRITDKLKGVSRAEFEALSYNFGPLEKALAGAAKRINKQK
ncbi:MAG TPA: ABC transporter substrate-binding protein [candidate division WOR-3 bacterium]|uniref:ABC transporter substrate-binding protein n=1 Tax=candidate division WOR-3 bacterium TaxID=2052148 RepID=A0A7V0XET3_UNCW3|nr:ABC transporter substrate-binding protein [candidate division WOR-3 bacterium]